MAKKTKLDPSSFRKVIKKRTSIGKSKRSKPTNKSKRRQWKKSRGQGDKRR